MSTQKSYFGGLANAKISDRSEYLEPDQSYVLKVKRTFIKDTRKKGDAFIAEFEVVATSSQKPSMQPGKTVGWYQGMQDEDVAFGAIKELCYALKGVDKTDKAACAECDKTIEKVMQDAVEKNSFAGTLVLCDTKGKENQDKTGHYTKHFWAPAPKA